MTRKLVSLLVAVLMVMAIIPMGALAAERENAAPATRGELDDALNVTGGNLVFTNDATYPWTVETEGDRTYAKSGNTGVNSSSSTITATVTAAAGNVVQFDYKAWGEGTGGEIGVNTIWDKCQFKVNDEVVLQAGAVDNTDWLSFTYAFTAAGEYTLTWVYSKDSSVSATGDYFAIDNVYVGQPVEAESITVQPVTVPGNRRAAVEYEVLPVNAADKTVTFAIADTSIATVDTNGIVTGVAEGTTTITVTSVAVPTVSGTATVTVTEALPAVDIYGFGLYPSSIGNKWITFKDWDPANTVEVVAEPAYETYSAAYVDGNVYFFTNAASGAAGDFMVAPFDDLANATVIAEGALDGAYRITSMGYDAENEVLYGLYRATSSGSTEPPAIVTIDMETGAVTVVFEIDDESYYPIAMAVSGEGDGYLLSYELDDSGYADGYVKLFSMNLSTGALTEIGDTGLDANYVQDMCYDDNTDTIYWANLYTASVGGFYAIDPETGDVEDLGQINGTVSEVVGLFTIPAEDPGPEPTDEPVDPTEPPAPAENLDEALNVEGGNIHFESTGTYPWVVVNEDGVSYAKSSNEGNASTSSTMTATVTAVEGDIVQFDFKAWGEGSSYIWDECSFAIDGNTVFSAGAYDNADWETFAYELTAGEHTLTWDYTKDSSVDPDGDYFAVDNVYVGQPVAVASIEAPASIEVPVNRNVNIQYTVLPADAFNKAVTFTSADETIATVSETGSVTGVAEGNTTITIASVENPAITATVAVNVVDMGYTLVDLYGFVAYDLGGMYDGQVVHFNDADPANIIDAHDFGQNAYAAAFAGGNVYGFVYDENGSPFFVMDAETYSVSYTGVTSELPILAMAYDHSSQTMYGLNGDEPRNIVTINLATGNVTAVAPVTGMATPMTLAIDMEGNAYAIEYQTGDLYSLNLETGAATLIGATGVPMAYVQGMTYDFANEQIYWAQILDGSNAALYVVDPTTAAATNMGAIGGAGMEVCGLYIKNELEIAPIEMPDVTVTFVDGYDNTIIDTMVIEAGNTLMEDDFPEAPEHEGMIFAGWDYDGSAIYSDTTITARYQDPNATIWDFETDPEAQGWQFVDNDGDGNNWEWHYGPDYAEFNYHEGQGYMMSASYINYVGALMPNNSAFTPVIAVGDNTAISFWAQGQDPSYCAEVIGVFVDGMQVGNDITLTGDDTQYTFNLSMFSGDNVNVEIRHYNVTDMFQANLDYVEVSGNGGGTEPTPTPTPDPTPTPEPPVGPVWGDADGDGELTLQDALMIMRYALELIDEIETDLCDVNGDGEINLADALLVLRKVMGIIDSFPVE